MVPALAIMFSQLVLFGAQLQVSLEYFGGHKLAPAVYSLFPLDSVLAKRSQRNCSEGLDWPKVTGEELLGQSFKD